MRHRLSFLNGYADDYLSSGFAGLSLADVDGGFVDFVE